jgi:putative Holliday junction resolvase
MPAQVVMGFDYGSQRIGVAVGQTLTDTASPVSVIFRKNGDYWRDIDKLTQEWQPTIFVVGMSRHADGSNNENTLKIQHFCALLNKRYHLPVYTIDETLTSVAAKERLSFQPKKLNTTVDALAAQIILETWFSEFFH